MEEILAVMIDFPDGATDEEIRELVDKVSRRVDLLHRAHGGQGVVVHDVEVRVDPEMVKASREASARGDCLTTKEFLEEIRGKTKTKT